MSAYYRHRRPTKAERARAEREYLRERMPCVYVDQPLVGRQRKPRQACRWCGRPKVEARWPVHRQPCPRRRRPNRWRIHFSREQAAARNAEERLRERREPLDVRMMRELRKLEDEAKWLQADPMDCRLWAFHPVPRRYRRLVKRLWTMPLSTEAAYLSPTRNRLLTRKGDMR